MSLILQSVDDNGTFCVAASWLLLSSFIIHVKLKQKYSFGK